MSISQQADEVWFRQFPDRQAHIRMPIAMVLVKNKQRAMGFQRECEAEFRSLGDHDMTRRRIILWKVPPGNRYFEEKEQRILKIPFLAYSDETIADEDSVLLPIIAEIMGDALRKLDNVVE